MDSPSDEDIRFIRPVNRFSDDLSKDGNRHDGPPGANKKPGQRFGRVSNIGGALRDGPLRSAAHLDAAEAPSISIPESLANKPAGRTLDIDRGRCRIDRTAGGNRAANDRATDEATYKARGHATLGACRGRGERTGNCREREQGGNCLLHF
jgi:hypothetical protein